MELGWLSTVQGSVVPHLLLLAGQPLPLHTFIQGGCSQPQCSYGAQTDISQGSFEM